jgi:hypothetical protein
LTTASYELWWIGDDARGPANRNVNRLIDRTYSRHGGCDRHHQRRFEIRPGRDDDADQAPVLVVEDLTETGSSDRAA